MSKPVQPGAKPEEPQAESMLTIIKKEFFDLGGHEKEDTLKKNPFVGLTKSSVLQECRLFNDSNAVTSKPEQCILLMAKVLYLVLVDGEDLRNQEVSDVFFGATKLFQSQDPRLRRMVYLFIKEIAEKTSAEEVIIVISTLLKDLNSENELFRSNSLRVLSRILDGSLLAQVERYIKQAVVHKNPTVASSAVLCGLYLYNSAPEVVRKWVNEVNQCVSSSDEMVQYHGLLLLHAMKREDKLAMNKLLTQLISRQPTSPLAVCMLIRFSATMVCESADESLTRTIYDMLIRCLRHSKDSVCFEAAKALLSLPGVSDQDLIPVINMLQGYLSSVKNVCKFAAVRILNQMSIHHAPIILKVNTDLENLVNDSNRSIATLAVSTLLKTVGEDRISYLLKQISGYMSEIDDDFKMVLVRSIYVLSEKFPNKVDTLLSFLSQILNDEGTLDLKSQVVSSILQIMSTSPHCIESALMNLCEFIEDCEFGQLCIQVLHIISLYGPSCSDPSHYVRYIYNRLILENEYVRAAAVHSLSVFAGKVECVRESVTELLKSCLNDESDEVRDRAILALAALHALIHPDTLIQTLEHPLNQPVSAESTATTTTTASSSHSTIDPASVSDLLLFSSLPMSVPSLSASIAAYKLRPTEGPIDFEHIPHIIVPDRVTKTSDEGGLKKGGESALASSNESRVGGGRPDVLSASERTSGGASNVTPSTLSQLYKMKEFSEYGVLLNSSKVKPLTEEVTEYYVTVQKHIFKEHIVLQFNVKNTIKQHAMKNVGVNYKVIEGEVSDWKSECMIRAEMIKYEEEKPIFVSFKYEVAESGNEGEGEDGESECMNLPECSMNIKLSFEAIELMSDDEDPSTIEGYKEEYPIENVSVTINDYMSRPVINDYRSMWNSMASNVERKDKIMLPFNNLNNAMNEIVETLGLYVFDGTNTIPSNSTQHVLLMGGSLRNKEVVLCRCNLVLSDEYKVVMEVFIRSKDQELSELMLSLLH